jgi:P-type Cu+ transporter
MSTLKLQLPISGMTCAGCSSRLQRTLGAVPGIEDAAVNLATERASVSLQAPASP